MSCILGVRRAAVRGLGQEVKARAEGYSSPGHYRTSPKTWPTATILFPDAGPGFIQTGAISKHKTLMQGKCRFQSQHAQCCPGVLVYEWRHLRSLASYIKMVRLVSNTFFRHMIVLQNNNKWSMHWVPPPWLNTQCTKSRGADSHSKFIKEFHLNNHTAQNSMSCLIL